MKLRNLEINKFTSIKCLLSSYSAPAEAEEIRIQQVHTKAEGMDKQPNIIPSNNCSGNIEEVCILQSGPVFAGNFLSGPF